MTIQEEKTERYADLARRLAASKIRSEQRRQEKIFEESPEKGNGSAASAKPTKKAKPSKKLSGSTSKLTGGQKDPTLSSASSRSPEVVVDPKLITALHKGREIEPNKGLTVFQVALVDKIREKDELGILELCRMVWSRKEIAQARSQGKDLTRIVRNAIRLPKTSGILKSTGRGKYVFVGWKNIKRTRKSK